MLERPLTTTRPARALSLLFILLALLTPAFPAAAEPTLHTLAGGLIQEKGNGRTWQMERSKKLHSLQAVQQYLHQLNQGTYHDWRLPSKWELYNLFTLFDLKKNGDITIALEGSYWLDDGNGSPHPGSWETGDQCGVERSFYPARSGYVRAVRP